MKPLVSFLTVTFSHEPYIRRCIEGVQAQTLKNWEMVIVDDDSTDKTPEIVQSIKDRRIRLVEQEHQGIWNLSKTYNNGLLHCSGKYIAVLDGDDFSYPQRLEKSLEAIGDNVAVCGRADVLDKDGNKLRVVPPDKSMFQCSSHVMLTGCHFSSCTYMVRKESLMAVGGFQKPSAGIACDYATWLALLGKGEIAYIDDVLGAWVQHGNNATSMYGQYARLDLDAMRAFRSWSKTLQKESGWTLMTLKFFWAKIRFRQKVRSHLRILRNSIFFPFPNFKEVKP